MIAQPHVLKEDLYELVRSIGSGSFGQVYLVMHKRERRQYVMKSVETNEENHESTKLEVRLLSGLRHPNIVAYHDSFEDSSGHLCILMEYCEHGDVYTYLQDAKKRGRVPEEARLLEWFIQVCLALHALHHKNILHRDLKTQNIFLTGNKPQAPHAFALKLGDFGIAKVLTSTSEFAKTQIGTPFYMSPELINNKPYGIKSDIWGLGCVLYEIINGKRAFDAHSLNGLALKIIKGHYSEVTERSSAGTKALIKTMLSRSPAHRPTLKEILHLSLIRPRIANAHRNVMGAAQPDMRQSIEQALNAQLTTLGLGALVNAYGHGQPAKKDKRRLLQRLKKAEDRKKREEEVLQQTVALLAQCLQDTAGAPPLPMTRQNLRARSRDRDDYDGELSDHGVTSFSVGGRPSIHDLVLEQGDRRYGYSRHSTSSHHEGSEMFEEEDSLEDELLPPVSHRDRPRRRDRRHEEAQQRHAPMRRHPSDREERHSRRHHAPQPHDMHLPGAAAPPLPHGRPREEAVPTHNPGGPTGVYEGNVSSVQWMLDYQHVQPQNLAHPFDSVRPNVVHSPRQTRRPHLRSHELEPSPPAPQYGEPMPPGHAPRAPGGHLGAGWRTGDLRNSQHARQPIHTVCLEALSAPNTNGFQSAGHTGGNWHPQDQRQHTSELSDPGSGSINSESLTEMHEEESSVGGLSDAESSIGSTSGSGRRRNRMSLRPQVLQQRIDDCQAAIYRHRMTIEMLEYCYADGYGNAVVPGAGADYVEITQAVPVQDLRPESQDSIHEVPPVVQQALNGASQMGGSASVTAPTVIQDCAARLLRRCQEGLGSEKFQAARLCMQTSLDAAEVPASVRARMLELLGMEKIGFLSLIDQLVHIERRWGAQDGVSQRPASAVV